MTTRKTAKAKPAAKKPDASPVVNVVDTDDPAVAERNYAKNIDGWAEMSQRQRDDIIALTIAYAAMPPRLAVTLDRSEGGNYALGVAKGDTSTQHALRTAETFASSSPYFSTDKLNELINHLAAHNNRGARELDLNSALAFIGGAKPQNEVEATLAVQMVATNDAAMRALAMVGKSEWVPQTQMFGNLAVKLLRTFTMQAEALSKLQRGGEQVVKHIHVDNRGGQAVIAETVNNGGTGNGKKAAEQSYGAGTAGSIAALPSPDPLGNGVPIPSRERQAALQDARRD